MDGCGRVGRQRVVGATALHIEEELFRCFKDDVAVEGKGEVGVSVVAGSACGVADVAVLGVVVRDLGELLPEVPHFGLGFPVGAVTTGYEDGTFNTEGLSDLVEFATHPFDPAFAIVETPRLIREDDHVGVKSELLHFVGSAGVE